MIIRLLIIGFFSLIGQVVILRELSVAYYGVEIIYILAMALWMLWTATGALLGRRGYVPSATVICWIFILAALLVPLDVAFIRLLRPLFGGVSGTFLPFGLQLLALVVALLPIGVLLGLLFQWAAKSYVATGRKLASAYAIESAGGLLGGLAATFLLKFGVQNFTIGLLSTLTTLVVLLVPRPPLNNRVRGTAAALLIVVGVVVLNTNAVDRYLTRANHQTLVDTRDSPYGRITVTRNAEQYVVFQNDALAFETQSTAAEELVHCAVANHPNPRRILVLGAGVGGILSEVLKYAPEQVDYVEPDRALLALAEAHLPDEITRALTDRAVQVRHEDPRQFLKTAEPYDLILVGGPAPLSALSNRFYTQQFFGECRGAMTPGGVLAFGLPAGANVWTRFDALRGAGIYGALDSVFADIVVLPGTTNIFLASDSTLSRDPDSLASLLASRAVSTRLVTPQYIHYLYTSDRFATVAERLTTTPAEPNTDAQPICYRYSGMSWLSKFFPAMINWDAGSLAPSGSRATTIYIVLGVITAIVFVLVRRSLRRRRMLAVAAAACAGMILETVVILLYQTKNGTLFLDLGILLMAFMMGLTLGSLFVLGLLSPDRTRRSVLFRVTGYTLFLGFVGLGLMVMAVLRADRAICLQGSSFLLCVDGFLVSGVLAYASLWKVDEQKLIVSPLYGADLLGGVAGALLGSLLLIPFGGMLHTTTIVLILSVVSMLLI